LHAAGAAIVPFREAGAKALEIMDRASLRAVEDDPGIPASVKTLPESAAAILAEFQCAEESEIPEVKEAAEKAVAEVDLLEPPAFTQDPAEQELLWAAREGLLPAVAAVRKSGTSVINEDLVFPIEHLADAILDLAALFEKHGYDDGVIYGHAKEGNMHFAISQSFDDRSEVDRYARFMDDVVNLVVKKYDGALKAEHGTGRNMAPFLETEWGPEAVGIMKRLKALADPGNLLNPGVIINSSPTANIENLKSIPTIEEEADQCMECGYCEHVCPSRELSLTPRQRIVVRREMVRQEREGGATPLLRALEADYQYLGINTCAGDGMCQTQCPVEIDTGALIKRFRHRGHSPRAEAVANGIAKRYAIAEPLARTSLRVGHAVQSSLGSGAMIGVTGLIRSVVGNELFPLWSKDMPRPTSGRLPDTTQTGAQAIYFPACINRIFGHSPGELSGMTLPEAFVALTRRAEVPVYIPENVAGICCGTPWHSKGYVDGNKLMANKSIERCWEWSSGGRIPIVVDASSCTHGFRTCRDDLTPENRARFDRLEFVDSVEFAHDELLPKLRIDRKLPSVAVHPVCSVVEMHLTTKLGNIGKVLGEEVIVPIDSGCCGFAGDRGFLWPELTASATRHEAEDLKGKSCAAYVSSNRTCEVGMTRATEKGYRSFIYPLEEATRGMDVRA
jgi:D-lactate dehydrogenase